jgi:hypothetical protein
MNETVKSDRGVLRGILDPALPELNRAAAANPNSPPTTLRIWQS